jgi:hypothetical protein
VENAYLSITPEEPVDETQIETDIFTEINPYSKAVPLETYLLQKVTLYESSPHSLLYSLLEATIRNDVRGGKVNSTTLQWLNPQYFLAELRFLNNTQAMARAVHIYLQYVGFHAQIANEGLRTARLSNDVFIEYHILQIISAYMKNNDSKDKAIECLEWKALDWERLKELKKIVLPARILVP